MVPRYYLSPAGQAAVKARAAELATYLLIRRMLREARK